MENFLQALNSFFAGFTGKQLIIGAISGLIAFFPSVNILQWVKNQTGWKDRVMHKTVVAFFMLLSALTMIATGEISPGSIDWTLETLLAYFGVFSTIGEAAYQRLKARNS